LQIKTVHVHNFRSLIDVTYNLHNYGLLVGANNSGKTNAIDAIRVFYDDLKYNAKADCPKDGASDEESWVEIEFKLTNDEYTTLKDEYRLTNNRLKVRKYLTGKTQRIFAYTGEGYLSADQFYGAKNVQQAKLGDIIYIPAVSKLDEHIKTSGPSALRDIINGIVGKLVKSSPSFQQFVQDFSQTMETFQEEKTDDDFSLKGLQDDINEGISEWDAEFSININPFSETEIVKNLVSFDLRDRQVNDTLPADYYGQGFQRHLIYTLLTLVSKYDTKPKSSTRTDFRPNLTLILFEEPEAYLHPPQQDALSRSLQLLSTQEGNQVLLSTHSTNFVSQNTDDLPAIIHLSRQSGKTTVGQLSSAMQKQIFQDNQQINSLLGVPAGDENWDLDMEAVKYFLWLDPYRCGLFFAERVLLVEGPTEVVFINYLMSNGLIPMPKGGLFVLDCIGKYNIHRYMNLLGELGISHSVLYDEDDMSKPLHQALSSLIGGTKNAHTYQIEAISPDLEGFLGVVKALKPHQKPQHLMYQYHQGGIASSALNNFTAVVNRLIQ